MTYGRRDPSGWWIGVPFFIFILAMSSYFAWYSGQLRAECEQAGGAWVKTGYQDHTCFSRELVIKP